MGCACKNDLKKFEKYADGKIELEDNETLLGKIFQMILQFCFGIVAGAVIIIAVIPLLVYIIGCLLIGKQPFVKLFNIKKIFSKKK
jgi:hypothetical protein